MMENDIYITQLPGSTKATELVGHLESKIPVKCTVSVRQGKIPGTNIAFGSIGGHDVDDAIAKLNNSEFKGHRIKVQRYIKTERNRRFNESHQGQKEKNVPDVKPIGNDFNGHDVPATNGKPGTIPRCIGVMVHVTSAEEFYIQVVPDCHLLSLVNSQMTLLDHGHDSKSEHVKNPKIGNVCAARYSADNKYYRALILSEEYDNKVDVRFVDYGNKEVVNVDSLVILAKDIAELDFVAKRCRFIGITVEDDQKATEMLRTAGEQYQVERYSESRCDDYFKLWEVDLFDDSGRSLREHMIAQGCLKPDPQWNASNALSNDSESPPYSNSNNATIPCEDGLSDALSPIATCIITHIDNVNSFYIQGAFDKRWLNIIHQCLMDIESLRIIQISNIVPNRLYCAMYSLDGKWYRCRVKLSASDKPEVNFVDFGNSENLQGDLRELPTDVAAIRPQALCCQLSGIRILNPEKVKAELTELAMAEVSLKCTIQKDSEDKSANVDFGIEAKYRSICSWLIEQRLAERMYVNKPSNSFQPYKQLIPSQVTKRNRSDVTQKPMKKRESFPRSAIKNDVAKKTGHSSQASSTKCVPVGDGPVHVVDPIYRSSREKLLLDLTKEIDDAFNLRRVLSKWRAILGINPNGTRGESLIDHLEELRKMKDDLEFTQTGSEHSRKNTHRKLIRLRKTVMDNRSAFCQTISDLSPLLSGTDEDKSIAVAKADERDRLAQDVIDSINDFTTEFRKNSDVVNERIRELQETIFNIDFLLEKCPCSKDSEKFTEFANPGREMWANFLTSDRLNEVVEATDSSARQLENTRQSLSFITGFPGDSESKHGSQSVKSFFPNLESLITAMREELATYTAHFVSGNSGKIMVSCLTLYRTCVMGLTEELTQLETDTRDMVEFSTEAAELLSARSALTDDKIENMETAGQKMKKVRSQLRHHLADLEDAMESESGESSEVEDLRLRIDKIRKELHTILKDLIQQKELIYHALNLRPELSLTLVKRLKTTGPTMCNKDVVSSWETSYFDLKPLDTDHTLFASKFGEDEVFIKKILITGDGNEVRKQIKSYQETISSCNSTLLPIIAAFVPPKETHVLYYIMPAFEPCNTPSDVTSSLLVIQTFLQSFYRLSTAGLSCVTDRPLDYLARSKGENRVLLKPSAVLDANPTSMDFSKLVLQLNSITSGFDSETVPFDEIFRGLTSVDHIPTAIHKIKELLSAMTLLSEQCVSATGSKNNGDPEGSMDGLEGSSKEESSFTDEEQCRKDDDKDIDFSDPPE